MTGWSANSFKVCYPQKWFDSETKKNVFFILTKESLKKVLFASFERNLQKAGLTCSLAQSVL